MDLTRQQHIVRPEALNREIHVVGVGAIGSFVTLNLAKMGYAGDIHVWDPDTIDELNIPNQFYYYDSPGRHKTSDLFNITFSFAQKDIVPHPVEFEGSGSAEAVILAVDSMDTRIAIYKSLKQCEWLFDGRMGAEVMRIYTINMFNDNDRKLYEENLYTSDEAQKLPCTARAIVYNVSVVAGLIANQVKRAFSGQEYKREIIFDLATTTILTQ